MMRLTRCAGWAAIAVVAIAAITVVGCGGGGGGGQVNTGSITGTIVHAGTGLGLGGITVAAGGITTTTGADGRFTLNNVPVGQRVVTITIPADRGLVLPPMPGNIEVVVRDGQTTDMGLPILLVDDTPPVPNPPTN